MTECQDEIERVANLTTKQRECLHLVVQRKSSKEIARILNISKPAVDQRLDGARRTLGVATRDEAAVIFARTSGTYDRIIYDPAYVPIEQVSDAVNAQSDGSDSFILEEAANPYGFEPSRGLNHFSIAPEEPSGDIGTIQRIAWIVAMTIGILAIALVGLSVSQSLSDLLSA